MTLFEIGRVCLKLAGRDANKRCVVVDTVDNTYVLVDGETRRKKVNTKHLEPLAEIIEINSGASHEEVKTAFKELGINIVEVKSKTATSQPVKHKKLKKVKTEGKKAKVEAVKKEEPKVVAEKPKKAAKKE